MIQSSYENFKSLNFNRLNLLLSVKSLTQSMTAIGNVLTSSAVLAFLQVVFSPFARTHIEHIDPSQCYISFGGLSKPASAEDTSKDSSSNYILYLHSSLMEMRGSSGYKGNYGQNTFLLFTSVRPELLWE